MLQRRLLCQVCPDRPVSRTPALRAAALGLRRVLAVYAAAIGFALGAVAFAGDAGAQGGGASPAPMPTPPAPPGDGADAGRIINEVEATARDPRMAKIVAEPLRKAKKALERAHGARMSADIDHARMLDGLALEWAETAKDLVRAAVAEEAASDAARKARELSMQVERARALLEETQARRGRAAAELERAEAEAQEAAKKAAVAEEERVEKGRKKPGASKEGGQGGAGGAKKKKPDGAGAKGSPKGAP